MLSSSGSMSDTAVKGRYYILDAYRGLCVLLMILHHGAFDLTIYGYLPVWLTVNPVMSVLQPFFAGSFIVMSGASCRFSRSNLKKGIILALISACVSVVTYFFTPDMFISFGILHFLACASLIYHFLRRLFEKYEKYLGLLCLAVFFVLFFIFPVYIGTDGLAFLGFPTFSYASGDYYPILPWIFLFFFGAFWGGLIKEGRMPSFFYTFRCPFFEKIGKLSLIIYLAHQPLLYALVTLLSKIK